MESSRDSGCRHELGRLVQFCACRKPTITICRVMLSSLSRQIELGCEFVLACECAKLLPRRVLDLDTFFGPLLLADVLALAGIEHAGRTFRRRRRFQITRELADFLLELLQRPERRDIEHRHEGAVIVPAGWLDAETQT